MAPARKKKTAKATTKRAESRARLKPKAKTKAKAKAKTKAKARTKLKEKTVRRATAKKGTAIRSGTTQTKRLPLVEPGPPAGSAPPVEEPIRQEEAVGVVTHYYSHLGVAVVQVNKAAIRSGDQVHIKGHTTDLTQIVGSMEYEHQHVESAEAGKTVGLKVMDHVREHDIVYLIK